MDTILFASLYTGGAMPTTGIPFASAVNVAALIVAGAIDSLKVAVMLVLEGAVVVVGNVASTVGGSESIMPVTGVTKTFGTVASVPDTAMVPVLGVMACGPAAISPKVTLKVQEPAGPMTGAVKHGLAGSIWKKAASAPWAIMPFGAAAIVRVPAELRLVTVTVIGGTDLTGKPPIVPKSMVVGVIDIPTTFPSRLNNELGDPVSAGTTLTEVTAVPVTATGVTELPI
jgi:hypothetical protein